LALKSEADADVAPPERMQLEAGGVVTRPLDFERGDGHYVGGVATGLVPASPDRVLAAIDDADALSAMLPLTKRVSFVDKTGPARRIELRQGNSVIDATYTVELSKNDEPGEVRFHMDRTRHHDIDDVYGYFKVERYDATRSIVTVAAAVDIGSGVTQFLFGKRVQDVILSTPYVMRGYFTRAESSNASAVVAQNHY
jgi:carbon monoxide dehydrogenase subunit G